MERPIDIPAQQLQLKVLGVLGLAYAALATFWAPPHNWLLLPLGLGAMLAAGALGRWLGPTRAWLGEPALVWLALVMLIVIPGVANPPAPRGRGFVVGFLGVFCALGFWALFRYPTRTAPAARRPLRRDLALGLAGGAGMAALLSLIALFAGGVAAVGGEELPLGWIIAAYWAGGLAAGAMVGLARRIARWPLGSMLMGVPVAVAVYGAMGIAMMLSGETSGPEHSPGFIGFFLTIVGAGFGPMLGLGLRNQMEPRS